MLRALCGRRNGPADGGPGPPADLRGIRGPHSPGSAPLRPGLGPGGPLPEHPDRRLRRSLLKIGGNGADLPLLLLPLRGPRGLRAASGPERVRLRRDLPGPDARTAGRQKAAPRLAAPGAGGRMDRSRRAPGRLHRAALPGLRGFRSPAGRRRLRLPAGRRGGRRGQRGHPGGPGPGPAGLRSPADVSLLPPGQARPGLYSRPAFNGPRRPPPQQTRRRPGPGSPAGPLHRRGNSWKAGLFRRSAGPG